TGVARLRLRLKYRFVSSHRQYNFVRLNVLEIYGVTYIRRKGNHF
ncbi:unnamed protein product, partial [marine sediment metagenome]